MSKILITNYRGFDIEFDTDYEKFQCIITEERAKESNSFFAIKGFIDDYKKNNQDFKPFWIESMPNSYRNKVKLKVIGIRKDGRFVAESKDGKKEQISDYDISNYMIVKPENESILSELSTLKNEIEQREYEDKLKIKEIISKLNIVSLKDFKLSL